MGVCSHCGNEYDKTFDVKASDGRTATFDSFECAIAGMAPRCAGCGVPIIGHSVEEGASMYCCRACAASANGESAIRDRV